MNNLPGYEIFEKGLKDLAQGKKTPESFSLLMARERLVELGLELPPELTETSDPHIALYRCLEDLYGVGAHSKYKAYERRLHSFLRALVNEKRT